MRFSTSISWILLTTVSFVSLTKRISSRKKGKSIENREEKSESSTSVIVTNAECSSSSAIVTIPPNSAVQVLVKANINDQKDLITEKDLGISSRFESSDRYAKKMRILWEIQKKHLETTSRDRGRIRNKLKDRDDELPVNMPNCYYVWLGKNNLKKSKVEQVLKELMGDNYSEEAMESFYKCQLRTQRAMYGGGRGIKRDGNSAELIVVLFLLVVFFAILSIVISWWDSTMK